MISAALIAMATAAAPNWSSQRNITLAPAPIHICGQGPRVNCVVDGDTVWLLGKKYRIAGIDAPEKGHHASCEAERKIAKRASIALRNMLAGRRLLLIDKGVGYFGRPLIEIHAYCGWNCSIFVGESMIDSGLAQPWPNSGNPWCAR